MTISLLHSFDSPKSDGTDATLIQPSNWDAEHTTSMATARVLGRTAASTGAAGELDADDVWTFLKWEAGTNQVFVQTSAPTGWTKQTTHDNKALRLVSGTPSSGGTSSFTTVFSASAATASHVVTAAEMGAHTHTFSATTDTAANHTHTSEQPQEKGSKPGSQSAGSTYGDADGNSTSSGSSGSHSHTVSGTSSSTGGGLGHTHTVNLSIKYVDIIYASKAA
jgi:hypothetical protein